MNYNYLRYFSVLAQVEHYTLAAARLGISQPSLSSAIHNLENDLGGVRLFEKVGRNIRLTDEGRFYQQKVDAALQELNSASNILRDSSTNAPVVIRAGLVSGMLRGVVAKELLEHMRQNSRVRFQLTESSSQELMNMVRQEKLDMAIVDTTDRDRSLHFRKLGQRDFCVAVPRTSPLAQREWLEPADIVDEPQVVFDYDTDNSFGQWASGLHKEDQVRCIVNTAQAALDLVAAGVGIAVLAQTCAQPREDMVFIPLRNWHQALYMCILYDKWLEPLRWSFGERVVNAMRSQGLT